MRILVTFAVEAEFAPWRRLRRFEKSQSGDMRRYVTHFKNAEAYVLLTGIGAKKAWVEAEKVLWNGDIDVCVSSGLAGALRAEHKPGEILCAESVYEAGRKREVRCDGGLVELAASCGAKVVKRFHSADHVVIQAKEKHELGLAADAVEMESGGVLYEAAAFGAKVAAVRGISDGVEEDLPLDFNRTITESGDVSVRQVLSQVARNPIALPSLIRFGQQSRTAAEKLAEFLDGYLVRLSVGNKIAIANGVYKR